MTKSLKMTNILLFALTCLVSYVSNAFIIVGDNNSHTQCTTNSTIHGGAIMCQDNSSFILYGNSNATFNTNKTMFGGAVAVLICS